MGWGLRRRIEAAAGASGTFRRLLTTAHLAWTDRLARNVQHPLDRRYGVRTQAALPLYLSQTGSSADAHMIPYAGCVPSVLRRALDALDFDFSTTGFLDLGCGKGRALLVASEYPFTQIVGVELNPDLVRAASANARRLRQRHPERTRIVVRQGDASEPPVSDADLVVFLYHPFGEPLVNRLCHHLVKCGPARLWVIYENPVHGHIFDAHADFTRAYAAALRPEADELGFGFDDTESVVVWRLSRVLTLPPAPNAGGEIVVVKTGYRAVVGPVVGYESQIHQLKNRPQLRSPLHL